MDESSGNVRFSVELGCGNGVSEEKIAGLLSVHYLMGGWKNLGDLQILQRVDPRLFNRIQKKTLTLLALGKSTLPVFHLRLTSREAEVFSKLMQNLSNKEIAEHLHVSERTIKFHISALLKKFGKKNRTELIVAAARKMMMETPQRGLLPSTLDQSNTKEKVNDQAP